MRVPKLFPRLAALACAALLLPVGSAPVASAQRRRARPQPRRPRATAPPRATNTPATTPAANPSATPSATQTPATTTAAPAAAPQGGQAARRPEADPAFEELLVADGYTVYAEIRRIGALALTEEVKSAVASLTLLGGDEVRPLTDFYKFVHDNAETLGESRVVMAFMPARAGLPQGVAAVEFESPSAAAAFEPKYRRLVSGQIKSYVTPKKQETPQAAAARGRRTQPAAPASMNDSMAEMLRGFTLRRMGRWLVSAESPFTFKKLRGGDDEPRLADSPRFQSVRSRFANDSLFVYVDTNVAQQGWALQMAKAEEERRKIEATQPPPDPSEVVGGESGVVVDVTAGGVTVAAPPPPPLPGAPATLTATGDATPEPSPEEAPDPEMSPAEPGSLTVDGSDAAAGPPPPTEEELAVRGMEGVLRNLWGGVPRIPGALALGLGLDRGALAIRLAVENTPDGAIAVIPFLPNVVSGAPVTAETVEVMPADAELFVAGSLDWTSLYNSTLGAASVNLPNLSGAMMGGGEREPDSRSAMPPGEAIAAVEKLFGFSFKEDLLPSLGAEVGFSMPLEEGDFILFSSGSGMDEEKKKEERDAEPGPLFVATLNDAEKMRRILPRVFVALGVAAPGAPQRPEKREGVEIRTLGAGDGLSYAVLDNYLVVGELKAVRHCVDSFSSRRTLASSNAYRDATSWQAKQKIVQLYLSETLFRRMGDQTRKRSGGSTDPAVRLLLAQLEAAEYAPASYEATNEGDVLLHELRLPLSLVKSYATATAVMAKDAPVSMGEMSAFYALQRVASAELRYKEEKKNARFGTLEELLAEKLLENGFLENIEYKIELSATADKFEATATPKNYGKTGRRSFFIDETMTVRAADRKGERATASDPKTVQ